MAEQTPENVPGEAAAPAADAGVPADLVAALASASAEAPISEVGDFGGMLGGAGSSGAEIDLSHLPAHTRSLLKIQVAVTVTLAQQRRPINEITELGPGTIVKFEKMYDEPLELTVGNLAIASGDVVKVGDKFGLRIGRIIRPTERFASVGQ